MTVSLRVVVGGMTALIVLIVAATTLAITYTVSIDAVRSTGQTLAASIVGTVALDVEHYIGDMERTVRTGTNISKIPGYMLPSDDPDVHKNPLHSTTSTFCPCDRCSWL